MSANILNLVRKIADCKMSSFELGAPQFDKQTEGGVRSTLLLLRNYKNYRSMQQWPKQAAYFQKQYDFDKASYWEQGDP